MTKTGRRDQNIDFLTKFDEIGEIHDLWQNFVTKFARFDERKMAFWRQNLAEISRKH